jgi:hypothetical protein
MKIPELIDAETYITNYVITTGNFSGIHNQQFDVCEQIA